jgi:hypothetical protein
MPTTRLRLRATAACGLLFLYACAAVPEGPESREQPAATVADLAGQWKGTLSLEDQDLDIIVRFAPAEPLTGSIDIPRQGARELPLANIRLITHTVYFELPAGTGRALFCGRLEQNLIMGSFTQSGTRGSFVLARETEAFPAPAGRAPGEPPAAAGDSVPAGLSQPVPGGLRQAGTLELLAGTPPFPAAPIISGSGPTDRDGNSPLLAGDNDSLKLLARGLAGRSGRLRVPGRLPG